MIVRPITRDHANEVVEQWHSHHRRVRSHRFALAAFVDDELHGVSIVGNPVAAALQNGITFEVLRLCTNGFPNAASFLLGASWRVAKAMGVERLISYTRNDELGTCYVAAGWRPVGATAARGWDSGNKAQRWLPGTYAPTTEIVPRVRWEIAA